MPELDDALELLRKFVEYKWDKCKSIDVILDVSYKKFKVEDFRIEVFSYELK